MKQRIEYGELTADHVLVWCEKCEQPVASVDVVPRKIGGYYLWAVCPNHHRQRDMLLFLKHEFEQITGKASQFQRFIVVSESDPPTKESPLRIIWAVPEHENPSRVASRRLVQEFLRVERAGGVFDAEQYAKNQ